MADPWSNIEPIARALCERGLTGKVPEDELPDAVAYHWHCVAAQLEAGIIGDWGSRLLAYEHGRDLKTYLELRRRHPDSKAPPLTVRMLHRD